MFLKRVAENNDGTFGVLVDESIPFALTLEPPWAANRQDISCIPEGMYVCKRIISLRFGETFEIVDVPGRTQILFHTGNTEADTRGCILVGEQYESFMDRAAVLASRRGFGELMRRLKGKERFALNIAWV